MKKLLTVLLILALVLPTVACTKEPEAPEEPENTESEEILATESESELESNTEQVDENCYMAVYSISEFPYYKYEEFVKLFDRERSPKPYRVLPKNFIHMSELSTIGGVEFLQFSLYAYAGEKQLDHTRYKYDLLLTGEGDSTQKMSLTVLHDDLSEPELTDGIKKKYLPAIYFREDYEVITDLDSTGFDYYKKVEVPVDYFYAGIRYTYGKNGHLTEIHWQSGDTKFWITFDEPLYIPYAMEHPLLGRFLDYYKNEDGGTIAWFDQVITADERTLDSGT